MEYSFTPTLSLALFDIVPCILYAVSFYYLLRFTRRNSNILSFYLMLTGVVIVEIGALSKVAWKTVNAVTALNIIELNNVSMYLISLGTLLIFISVCYLAWIERNKASYSEGTMYSLPFFVPVMLILSFATCGYLILFIMLAFTRKATKTVYMFLIYLVLTLAMAAFTPNGSEKIVHWVCEIINTMGTAALLIGAFNLNKADIELRNNMAAE